MLQKTPAKGGSVAIRVRQPGTNGARRLQAALLFWHSPQTCYGYHVLQDLREIDATQLRALTTMEMALVA